MEFKKEIVGEAKRISEIDLVDPRDIPKIDLYMEQVTSFLEQEIGDSLRFHDECVFTGTMINNYTKAGVLPRPENKRYSRRHILTLIFIFLLKQNLSMPEIKNFTSFIEDTEKLDTMYELYRDLLGDCAVDYVKFISDKLNLIDKKFKERGVDDEEMKALLFISLISFDATVSTKLSNKVLAMLNEKREQDKKDEEVRKQKEADARHKQEEAKKAAEEKQKAQAALAQQKESGEQPNATAQEQEEK